MTYPLSVLYTFSFLMLQFLNMFSSNTFIANLKKMSDNRHT